MYQTNNTGGINILVLGLRKFKKGRRKLNTYGQLKHIINCDQDQHWCKFKYSSDLFENLSTGYSFLITSQQNSQQHNGNMASVYEWTQLASCSKKLTKSCDHFSSQVSLICKHPWWIKSVHSLHFAPRSIVEVSSCCTGPEHRDSSLHLYGMMMMMMMMMPVDFICMQQQQLLLNCLCLQKLFKIKTCKKKKNARSYEVLISNEI
jgi:hypothetical protein